MIKLLLTSVCKKKQIGEWEIISVCMCEANVCVCVCVRAVSDGAVIK